MTGQPENGTRRRRVLLVVNRRARQGEAAHAVAASLLTALGFEVIDGSPRGSERITDRICELGSKADVVVVGGGDGTLNAVVEAVLKVGKPLGILPLGTANDLARTLNLPLDLTAACRAVADGYVKRIDLGRVNGKHFFNASSVGLSVTITDGLSKERKARWGVFAYLFAAVEAMWRWRPFDAELTVDGRTQRVKTVQVTVGNGRHYGGGLVVSADAAIDDERLDVLSLEARGWWELIPLLPALLTGKLIGSPRVRVYHGKRVELTTKKSKRVNTDGELTTHTPAKFEVLPAVLDVIVPASGSKPLQPLPALADAPVPVEKPIRRLLGWVGQHHLLTLAGVLVFLLLAAVVNGGNPSFDENILRGLRSADDPARPVGPKWLAVAMPDVTSLGGYTLLTLLTLGVTGYLMLRRRWHTALLLLVAAGGGAAVCEGLKGVFARPRPAVVPHLVEVTNASFPSGHAATATAVYLTLAVMLARTVTHKVVRAYLVLWALFLAGIVGISRVYLGVHYPTDVLAGWALGLSWALLCGLVANWFRRRREH